MTRPDASASGHRAQRLDPSNGDLTPSENQTSIHTAPGRTRTVCDLSQANAFSPGSDSPPAPVLLAFAGGQLHQYLTDGSWDLERAVAEDEQRLIRSFRKSRSGDGAHRWDELIFQYGRHAFVCADDSRLFSYAASLSEAQSQADEFTKRFGTVSESSCSARGGSFQLITVGTMGPSGTESVSLDASTVLSDEQLDLHFRDGFANWHRDFGRKLSCSSYGLTIFEGAPGTGKTSYLRHLMGALKESHRFYFIPTSTMGVLSDPSFIEFWSRQRRVHANRKFVVILEDSDVALMTRASDNREHVSALLNLTDGMLGDFLRLQIICTINCTTADIDPALLRPGRLLQHRVFTRLSPCEAAHLAKALGRTLPAARDYSLAEVFAGAETHEAQHPQIGFAA